MLKRVQSLVKAVLMATIFPALRLTGDDPPQAQKPAAAEPPAAPTEAAPPAKAAEDRIKDLEGELAGKTARIADLEKAAEESTTRAGQLAESLKKSIAGYKELIVLSNPDVLPELVSGETPEALNDSLAKGKELTLKVKSHLDAKIRLTRVPAGAPPRGPEDLSALSAREKIGRGLRK